MKFEGGRFARHRRFPWFAFNTLQRHRTRSQAQIFVRQNHDAGRLTAEELAAMLREGDASVARKMIRYGAKLRGTRAYWHARRNELTDMIRVKGSPHFFFTLSAADLQWPDLHQHMPPELPAEATAANEDATKRERRQRRLAVERNPHMAASYLDHRVQIFMKHYVGTMFPVKHSWYRYEWQERGSGHVHGFVWLKDAPNPDDINWAVSSVMAINLCEAERDNPSYVLRHDYTYMINPRKIKAEKGFDDCWQGGLVRRLYFGLLGIMLHYDYRQDYVVDYYEDYVGLSRD
ncbi:ATP-dependent DNA helicase [Mycena indigotica]|uniref:ATP-dependent DNA helicase n=1 Tax=Mycena indigotica TaxID=2126181 RepID=A0A8H6S5Y4_9AGAR|nr:ATP-dependent DNA helicase [Mycena indigotica]KAF7293451.1 ATP-dependent DNA helicase [Mycena indigotica]